MKRIVLIAVTLLCVATSVNAQRKSDMYLGGTIGFNVNTNGDVTSCGFNLMGEYGYFFMNNFRASLALGYNHSSVISKIYYYDGKHYDDTDSFILNPNVAYYVRIFDKFYYTPEFGLNFGFGANKGKDRASDGSKEDGAPTSFFSWGMYLSYAAFEYRPLSYLGLSFSVGNLSFGGNKVGEHYGNAFNFNFNSGRIGAKFYF